MIINTLYLQKKLKIKIIVFIQKGISLILEDETNFRVINIKK